jgi:hypothetical protein
MCEPLVPGFFLKFFKFIPSQKSRKLYALCLLFFIWIYYILMSSMIVYTGITEQNLLPVAATVSRQNKTAVTPSLTWSRCLPFKKNRLLKAPGSEEYVFVIFKYLPASRVPLVHGRHWSERINCIWSKREVVVFKIGKWQWFYFGFIGLGLVWLSSMGTITLLW